MGYEPVFGLSSETVVGTDIMAEGNRFNQHRAATTNVLSPPAFKTKTGNMRQNFMTGSKRRRN